MIFGYSYTILSTILSSSTLCMCDNNKFDMIATRLPYLFLRAKTELVNCHYDVNSLSEIIFINSKLFLNKTVIKMSESDSFVGRKYRSL